MEESLKLLKALNRFIQIRTECRFQVMNKYNISEFTIKQIEYLKRFDGQEYVTISQLAKDLGLSKPSITEMVKRFIKLNCIKREQCHHDGRVYYLFLTEKGRRIARLDQLANEHFFRKVKQCLNDEDINVLIEILVKVV